MTLSGLPKRERVVSIGTTLSKEKTRQRLGPGSGEPRGPQTVFVSRMRRNTFLPEHWSRSAYVVEVVIRAPGAD